MSVPVDPVIAEKLESFGRRRRSLIARRGAYAAVLSLIVSMCAVTLVDWLFFLSETARWVLSVSAYVTVLGVVWLTCLRLIWRVPSPARMARLIESAQPELREDLISAVELGDPSAESWPGGAEVSRSAMLQGGLDPTADACRLARSTSGGVAFVPLEPPTTAPRPSLLARGEGGPGAPGPGEGCFKDSTAFRSLLQQDVAQRVTRVHVMTLLPDRLIQRWLFGAVVAAATCLVLLVWPNLYFGKRIGRALLPMADIERVSLTKIAIVQPNPASVLVPQGESLPVTVELSGPECKDRVILETFRKGQGRKQTVMASDDAGGRRFTTTVRVDHELLRYRIRANDGHTKTHVMTARQRPQVVAFHKTFDYPAYLKMTATTETDKSGDLVAVEGTRVDLVVETSEAVASSYLSIEKGGVVERIALHLDAEQINDGARPDHKSSSRLRGTVVLDRSGTYRVHLVSAETGFENRFSPDYVLTAEPDLMPTIRIAEPAPLILVPPDEIVTLRGRAEDDWALDRIEQHTQINKNDWKATSLVVFDQRVTQHPIEHPWDLYPLGLEPGDELSTKLVAIDRKGNRRESDPIRVIISSPGFDPRRLHRLTAVRRAHDALVELAQWADGLYESVDAALTSRKRDDGVRAQQQMVGATDSVRRFDAESTRASEMLKSAVQLAVGSRESCDLVLANSLVAGAATRATSSLVPRLDQVAASSAIAPQADLWKAVATDSDTVQRTSRNARDLFGTLVVADTMACASMALIDTTALFRRAIDHARSSRLATDVDVQRIGRAERAVASQLQVLCGVLDDCSSLVDGGAQRQVEGIRQQLANIKSWIEANDPSDVQASRHASAGGSAAPESFSNLVRIEAQLDDTLGQMAGLLRETMSSSDGAWGQMADAGDAFHDLAFESLGHARRFIEMKRRLSERAVRGELDTLERDAQATRWQRDTTRIALETARAWFKAYADFAEARPDADYHLVNDLSHASQAIAAVAEPVLQGGDGEATAVVELERIASAVRVLGVIERLDDLAAGVRSLAELERNGANGANQAELLVANPHNWSWCEPQYEILARHLDRAHVSPKAVQMLTASRASAEYGTVTSELRSRLGPNSMLASIGRQPTEPPENPHRRRAETHRMPESPETPQPRWADARRSPATAPTPLRLVPSEAAKLALDLALIRQELQRDLINARSVLDRLATPFSRMIAEAAQAARQVEQDTSRLAQDAGQDERGEDLTEAREQLANVRDLARSLEDIRAALRRDANDQDVFNPEGRQRARDDDDALALLDQQPRAVEQALREAIGSADSAQRQQALTEATSQGANLSRRLEQLAEHFANVERGDPAATRPGLRDTESQLGVRDRLDEQHGRLDRLASLAELDPQQALSALERELTVNPPMQQALEQITRETVEQAQADLSQAAQRQREVSRNADSEDSQNRPGDGCRAEQFAQAMQQIERAGGTLTRRASEGAVPREPPANQGPPAEAMPSERAQNAAQRAAERAADAAREARQAIEAAEHAREAPASPDARLAAVQQAAERIAQAAAAQAIEAAAEAIEQAEAAAEAAQSAGQDPSGPASQQARNAQQAERAAARAGQAAQQAGAANEQAQAAAELAQDPQPATRLAADAAQQSEQLARQADRDPQSEIARTVEEAGRDVARAARNEARLGHQQSAAELREAAAAIDAAGDLAEMSRHSADAGAQASPELAAAQAAIEAQAQRLAELASRSGDQHGESASPSMTAPSRDGRDPGESGRSESRPGNPGSPTQSGNPGSPSRTPGPGEPSGTPGPRAPLTTSQSSPSDSGPPSQGTPASPNALPPFGSAAMEPEVAQQLARALDQLDGRVCGQAGTSNEQAGTPQSATESGSGAPASPTTRETPPGLGDAARAQAQAMAAARSGNRQQGTNPIGQGFVALSGGAGVASGEIASFETLPEIQDLTKRNWGKLPPKLAQDLIEGSRESVSPEYRSAIETYFRVIAQKARQRKE